MFHSQFTEVELQIDQITFTKFPEEKLTLSCSVDNAAVLHYTISSIEVFTKELQNTAGYDGAH